jgi:large subunit ribosomal protein L17
MRHRKSGVKLNRTTSHRQAMFRNMVTSLFKHDKIKTTAPKAKELRRWADHLITLAKRGDLHARRQALSIVREKDVVHKLFEEASERFGARSGGYTRIVKIGRRPGDAAPLTIIELLGPEDKKPATTKSPAAPKTEAVKEETPSVEPKKETDAGIETEKAEAASGVESKKAIDDASIDKTTEALDTDSQPEEKKEPKDSE